MLLVSIDSEIIQVNNFCQRYISINSHTIFNTLGYSYRLSAEDSSLSLSIQGSSPKDVGSQNDSDEESGEEPANERKEDDHAELLNDPTPVVKPFTAPKKQRINRETSNITDYNNSGHKFASVPGGRGSNSLY